MTKLAEAFAKSGHYSVSYKNKYDIGVVEIKLPTVSEIQKFDDGKYYRRTAFPCGKGAVVNITIFGEVRFLRKVHSNTVIKAYAKIVEKTIANSSLKKFYNLDIQLVNPNTTTYAGVKITQLVSKKETGRVFNCPQGGAIVTYLY